VWVRKTSDDIATERSRLLVAFGGPAVVFAKFFVVGFLVMLYGNRAHCFVGATQPQRTWGKVAVAAGIIAAAIAAVGYVCQVAFHRPLQSLLESPLRTIWICSRCHSVRYADGNQSCACGGTFEDLYKWRWVDDGDDRDEPRSSGTSSE
jgi:hypothetical protein